MPTDGQDSSPAFPTPPAAWPLVAIYRDALYRVNARIERLAGGGTNTSACNVEAFLTQPAFEEWEHPTRAHLATLAPAQLAEIHQLLVERKRIIRALKRADAAESRPAEWELDGPIAWDAPELDAAFGTICKAIVWDGPGARMYEFAVGQLWDWDEPHWVFAQADPFSLEALFSGLTRQLDEAALGALEDATRDAQASTWVPEVRRGFDFLLHLLADARGEVEGSRCPVCGDRRARSWKPGRPEGWHCWTCDPPRSADADR